MVVYGIAVTEHSQRMKVSFQWKSSDKCLLKGKNLKSLKKGWVCVWCVWKIDTTYA